MFSIEELNRVMPLDYPRHKLVDWSPAHYLMCDLNDFDIKLASQHSNYLEILKQYVNAGVAYTGIGEGKVYAMFGVYEVWKGSAEAWLIPSKHIGRKTISFHRTALLFFELAAKQMQIKRLQFTIHSHNVQALKWAERCYFEYEGTLRCYGPDGSDYKIYSRLFHHGRIVQKTKGSKA